MPGRLRAARFMKGERDMDLRHFEKEPELGEGVFVADNARVSGDVVLGEKSSVWYGAALRGDVNAIRVGRRSNVQDNATLHGTRETGPVHVGDDVTIGHNAVCHACTVEDGCLIGMGAVILDGAVVGAGSLVAAGAVVTPGTIVPPRSFVRGLPARVVGPLSDEAVTAQLGNAEHYVGLAAAYLARADQR